MNVVAVFGIHLSAMIAAVAMQLLLWYSAANSYQMEIEGCRLGLFGGQ